MAFVSARSFNATDVDRANQLPLVAMLALKADLVAEIIVHLAKLLLTHLKTNVAAGNRHRLAKTYDL